jgi:hypothetical protein
MSALKLVGGGFAVAITLAWVYVALGSHPRRTMLAARVFVALIGMALAFAVGVAVWFEWVD